MGKIRLLLALSVVAAHGGIIWHFNLVGGQAAIQSFFIISGFYMSMILNEKYIGVNNSYKLFITNRLLRLYPIYWAVLIGALLFSIVVLISSHGASLSKFQFYVGTKPNFSSYLFLVLTQLFIFGQDVVMFLGINPANGSLFFTGNFATTKPQLWNYLFIPQAWTLGVELAFYIIAPFVLRRGAKLVLVLILASFLLRLFTYDYLNLKNDPWTARFFPTEILFFLVGYFSYRIYRKLKEKTIPYHLNLLISCYIIFFLIVYSFLPDVELSYVPFTLKMICFYVSIALTIPFLFNFNKNNKVDNMLGELSYSIYISHLLILGACSKFHLPNWTCVLLVIAVSFLLNKFIAYPVEKYRQSRLKRKTIQSVSS